MSVLEVFSIKGQRGSACVNDAFSVVSYDSEGDSPRVLDIIPKSDLDALGKGRGDVIRAFSTASNNCSGENVKPAARRILGLQ